MEILDEIHFGIPLGVTLIILGFYLRWIQNRLYPTFIEKQIRKGKAWLYLPLNWSPGKRTQLMFLNRAFYVSLIALTFFSALISGINILWVIASTSLVGVILLFSQHFLVRKRYFQQVNAYFGFLDAAGAEFEREGKRFSEQELQNLASYQFQNALRSADSNGRLLKELDERS